MSPLLVTWSSCMPPGEHTIGELAELFEVSRRTEYRVLERHQTPNTAVNEPTEAAADRCGPQLPTSASAPSFAAGDSFLIDTRTRR